MKHIKNFNNWGIEKEKINNEYLYNFSPRPREIIFTKWGINIGFESDGKKNFLRPVLVLKKIGSLYWVVPLTSKLKENMFHYRLQSVSFDAVENSMIMLSQARVIDEKRFIRKIGEVSWKEYKEIQKKIKNLYF